jgi:hypothetical protein
MRRRGESHGPGYAAQGSGEQESLADGIRRAGHIAGVAAMSVVVFGSLYFFFLYIITE